MAPGCETGPIIPDISNPEIVYGSCKGQFSRRNMTTTDEMRYWIGAESLYGNGGETLTYRFQRVSPMEVSPHDPRVVYYGSQFVHRTRDGGKTWTRLSPDLTLHPPGTQEASGGPITRDATGEEDVQHSLFDPRIARAERRHLDRLQRRPGLRLPQRRRKLDERHASADHLQADAFRTSSPARIAPAPPTSRSIDIC